MHTLCGVPIYDQIIEDYVAADEAGQAVIERKYGANLIKRMVKSALEDRANESWKEAKTTACPGCKLRVERSQGCAKMTCSRCQTYFCFRCASIALLQASHA